MLTDLQGFIQEANRRAINFFGYPREELNGRHISELHPPDTDLPKARLIRGDSVRVFTSTAQPKDRHPIHVEIYAKRTTFGDNEVIQWIHVKGVRNIRLPGLLKKLKRRILIVKL